MICDWQIGRLVRSEIIAGPAAAGASVVVPANKQRIGMLISYSNTMTLNSAATSILVDGVEVSHSAFNLPQIMLSLSEHGDLVQKAITVSMVAGSFNTAITSFILPEEILTAALADFKRKCGIWR